MAAYRIVAWGRAPELVEVPVPEVGPGQVLVEVAGCGLCHSDLAMAAMPAEVGRALGWRVPFTLGHETAGRVAAVGAGVGGLAVGDPVALTSPSSCGACAHCRAGRDSACPHGDTGRGYGRDGGLARYVRVDHPREVLPLGGLDPRHAGPLTDAGATSFHAVRRVGPALGPGAVAVVIGVGGLGGLAVQILRAVTGARVVAVDLDPARRDRARALGAHEVVDGAAERLHRVLRGHAADGLDGVDAVIDVVGTDATIAAGMRALRRGGAFVLVGAAGGGYPRPWFGGLPREATISTVQGSARADAEAVVALAAEGRVRVDVDEYPLARVAEAYAALDAGTLTGRAVVVP
ncbi:MAG TPA: alcohol dehydrogenase catalytic domain-containing protein [Acidimicrobiales bacterium]|nr:alcohol dehydrogenase catalytic domain-containing protein [Acidimicrobiales bacterium]